MSDRGHGLDQVPLFAATVASEQQQSQPKPSAAALTGNIPTSPPDCSRPSHHSSSEDSTTMISPLTNPRSSASSAWRHPHSQRNGTARKPDAGGDGWDGRKCAPGSRRVRRPGALPRPRRAAPARAPCRQRSGSPGPAAGSRTAPLPPAQRSNQLELEGRTAQAVGVVAYGVFFLALAMRGSLLDRLLDRNLPLHLILLVQRM